MHCWIFKTYFICMHVHACICMMHACMHIKTCFIFIKSFYLTPKMHTHPTAHGPSTIMFGFWKLQKQHEMNLSHVQVVKRINKKFATKKTKELPLENKFLQGPCLHWPFLQEPSWGDPGCWVHLRQLHSQAWPDEWVHSWEGPPH